MKIEVTSQLLSLKGSQFMFYCTQEHPDKKFHEQCNLLMYAVMSDSEKFGRYVRKMISNPLKNMVAFYPATDSKKDFEGKEKVGTIIDGCLYFG